MAAFVSLDPLAILATDAVKVVLPVFYCRCVLAADGEPWHQRLANAAALAFATSVVFERLNGWNALALVLALQVFSTCAGWLIAARSTGATAATLRAACATAAACLLGAAAVVPLLPLADVLAVGRVVALYAGEEVVNAKAARLVLVTIQTQLAIGYLGVSYLRAAQTRKNALLQIVRPGGEASAAAAEAEEEEEEEEEKEAPPSEALRRRARSPARTRPSAAGATSTQAASRPKKPKAKRSRTATPAFNFARRVRGFLLFWALPYFVQVPPLPIGIHAGASPQRSTSRRIQNWSRRGFRIISG